MSKQRPHSKLEDRFLKIKPLSLSKVCCRMVSSKYDVLNSDGSLRYSGRYNNREFRVLYTADSQEICKRELARKTTVKTKLIHKIGRVKVKLKKVIDLTKEENLKILDIKKDDLVGNSWSLTQRIAALAYQKGYEAFVVPSVTGKGSNTILFPDNFTEKSILKKTEEKIARK